MASCYQGLEEGHISSSLTIAKNFTNEAALEMLLEGLSGGKKDAFYKKKEIWATTNYLVPFC